MSELQKKFQQEKYDRKYIENIYGYICYNSYSDGSLYIHELFTVEEKRNSGKGRLLEKALIKQEKPKVIYCDVDLDSNNPEVALLSILHAGYKIDQSTPSRIILKKEIKNA
jgi:hypothetical protein